MMLAQEQLAGLPDTFWKNFCIGLLVLLGAAATIVLIYTSTRKPGAQRLNDDPPIEVRKAAKRYNHDLVEMRFGRIETRLDGHDSEIDTAWNEMKQLREQNAERYTDIAVSLAEIKVHLGVKEQKK